jgi:ribosomal protein L13E
MRRSSRLQQSTASYLQSTPVTVVRSPSRRIIFPIPYRGKRLGKGFIDGPNVYMYKSGDRY